MKTIVLVSIVFSLVIASCAQRKEVKSSMEGTWQLISGKYITPDSVMTYPLSVNGKHIKIIRDKYFATIWQDTTIDKSKMFYSGFNGGTYTFSDGVYTEALTHFSVLSHIGSKASFKVEFKNDTLMLTAIFKSGIPAGYSNTEKWIKLE